jgi:RNA polymerase sigma-70 factor, ECF subfamily
MRANAAVPVPQVCELCGSPRQHKPKISNEAPPFQRSNPSRQAARSSVEAQMGTTTTWSADPEAQLRQCFGADLLPRWSAPQIVLTPTMTADDEAPNRADLLDGARSDEDLMLAFRDGDAAAFEQLVSRHKRGLYNFLLRSVHDRSRSEEMLQEVFLRVIRAKDRYQRTARFTTWIYTIARNLCVDESRRQKFRRTIPLEAKRRGRGGDDGQSILDVTEAQQVAIDAESEAPKVRERVAVAIDSLPDDQREVFMMRQFGGLSFKQIGEAVGAPENTVKSRMRYALEKLRSDLSDIDPRAAAIASNTPNPGRKVSTGG